MERRRIRPGCLIPGRLPLPSYDTGQPSFTFQCCKNMATIVDLHISIAGRSTGLIARINHLHIASRYDGHHTFELQASLSRIDQVDLNELESCLGEPIEIQYSRKGWRPGASSTFRGFVDEIIPAWTADGGRVVTLKGWSPTVFLDCGGVFRCYSETTLDAVLHKVLTPYRRYFNRIEVNVRQNLQVNWSVQNETDFQYLCRIADQSGVQEMWYDGECLHFDDLTRAASDEISLVKGGNLHTLSLSLNTAPLSFSVHAYDYVNGTLQQEDAVPMNSSIALIDAALRKSAGYPTQRISLPYAMEGKQGLRPLIRRFASRQAHELLVVNGQSDDPRLIIGSKITIDTKDDMLENELAGQFVVIHVNHAITREGQYENTFTAVPVSHPYNLRMTGSQAPVCGPMAAEVVDCNDPKKLGRVRVRFLIDEQKAVSPWFRCMTPFTSGGGVMQIPFKGEHVMVMGEGFNLERGGFVLDAYFHKNSPANKWNPATERGIRSGHSGMMFNDGNVKTWGKKVQANGSEKWSADAPFSYINCDQSTSPK